MLLRQSGPVALLSHWWPARRPGPCFDEPSRPPLVDSTATVALGAPSRVLLYFDPKRRLAALCKADEDDPRAYAATRRGHGGRQLSIAVARFVSHHKFAKGKYWASMKDGMLVFGVGPAY